MTDWNLIDITAYGQSAMKILWVDLHQIERTLRIISDQEQDQRLPGGESSEEIYRRFRFVILVNCINTAEIFWKDYSLLDLLSYEVLYDYNVYMSGFLKMVLKNWTPDLDFTEL